MITITVSGRQGEGKSIIAESIFDHLEYMYSRAQPDNGLRLLRVAIEDETGRRGPAEPTVLIRTESV